MGSAATPAAQAALVKALGDGSWWVRRDAAYAIGELGRSAPPATQAALVKALGDENWEVRISVAYAIMKLDASQLITTYCHQKEEGRKALLPFITRKLHTERLVIGEGAVPTLYQQVGSTAIKGLPQEGLQALQAALEAYREGVLKAAQTDE